MCERDGGASWVEPLSRRGGRLGCLRDNDRLRTADLGGRFMEPWAHDPVLRLAAWLRSGTMIEGGLRLRVSAGVRPASPDRGCQVVERSHVQARTVKPA